MCVQTSGQRSRGGVGLSLECSSFVDSRSGEDRSTDEILGYSFLWYSSFVTSIFLVTCEQGHCPRFDLGKYWKLEEKGEKIKTVV